MVVGKGLMAETFSAYRNDDSILIFASGVSDSTMIDKYEFDREFNLLKEKINSNQDKLFVYFSTCSIDDPSVSNRPYISHKLKVENYIKKYSSDYLIFRITNVVGPFGNPATVMNYFVNTIANNEVLKLWTIAERNFIDRDDVYYLARLLISKGFRNKTINLGMQKGINVVSLVKLIEEYLGKKALVKKIVKGSKLDIDVSYIKNELEIITDNKGKGDLYIKYLLNKYYKV